MKIAIISDIHDNIANLEKCLAWCRTQSVEALICVGDLTNNETLEILATKFLGRIHLVKGNTEIYQEPELRHYNNITYHGKFGRVKIADKQVGMCHEPFLIPKVLEQGESDIIFYGHTHEPWTEDRGNTKVVNPGTLGGMFLKATFAIWDTKEPEPELKILENL